MPSFITPTICRICKENCGILVKQSENGSLSIKGNPDHPLSKGFICFRGRHFSDIRNSRHRLDRPLLKVKGQWEPVSFETALDVMAEKFEYCRKEYGAHSVAFLKGEALKHQEIRAYLNHLAQAFGSPNYMSVGSLCHQSLAMGHGLTYGGIPKPDFGRIKCAVLWGSNIAVSSPRLFSRLRKAVKNGMKLIVIDPCKTRTTQLADLHLKITPGSDGLLALAFLKAAMETFRLTADPDRENGWNRLKETIDAASSASLLERTGIKGPLFSNAAGMIFENLPGWNLGGVALELQPAGLQAIRAIACLQSIMDPDTHPASHFFKLNSLPGQERYPDMPEPIGQKQASLYVKMKKEAQAMFLQDAILNNDPYPLRGMFIAGTNPVLTFPAASSHRKMFSQLDFLAVSDLFMTETAGQADLVLPAADHLDCLELHDYGAVGSPYLGLIRPVAVPGPGWPVWKWTFELAKKLGLNDFFPWETNEQAIQHRLTGSDVSLEALMASPSSVIHYQPEKKGLKVNKKIHYFSQDAQDAAGAGIPTLESFTLPFYPDSSYPLWLSTGDRISSFQHSQFRVSKTHLRKGGLPVVEVHPEPAAAAGIQNDDRIQVVTRYGNVVVTARITDTVRPDCLRMTHGWNDANVNEVTGLEYFDPLSGFPWCRALPARISLCRE